MSRADRPKQLLPLPDGRTLIELAVERLGGLVPTDRQYICAGAAVRSAIERALPGFPGGQILAEPVGRDTANAVAFTATVLSMLDPDAVFAVLTADHIIQPLDVFQSRLERGFELVEHDHTRFVTFGITPTHAATEYGYLERAEPVPGFEDCFRAARFVEKPVGAEAQRYLTSGRHDWNSGMFVFQARTVLEAIHRFLPESHAAMLKIAEAWGRDELELVLNAVYPALPKKSVDHAIMEPASTSDDFTVCIVPMPVQWVDVGSWTSYAATIGPDEAGNRALGPAVNMDSRNVVTVCEDPHHTIATIGCADLIVVHTADATLVCPADRAQDVKELFNGLAKRLQ